jgi:predicted DNA-binding protein
MKSRLDALAEATGRPAAYYVKAALEDRMDDLEWAYGIAANAENLRAGRRPTRPIDSCKQAQDRYKSYIEARRLFREVDGKRVYLSDQELTDARARAKLTVDEYCS